MLTAVDLFAGAGGSSLGASMAGLRVLWAANHDPVACEVHAVNHPSTHHSCQDLQQADFTAAPGHDVLLASPACQGHSRARGKERPHHDAVRATAWAVTTCAEVHRPRVLVVENVPEFRDWALFPVWLSSLEALGYRCAVHVLQAADWGVPQSRRRLFVVGHQGRPILLENPRMAHIPASEVVDFSAGVWSPVDAPGRAAATLRRVKEGRRQHGARFLLAYYGSEQGGRSLDRPLGTITTVDRFALVDGDRMRMLSADETRRAMGFPEEYYLPPQRHVAMRLLGNAVPPPLMAGVLEQIGGAI